MLFNNCIHSWNIGWNISIIYDWSTSPRILWNGSTGNNYEPDYGMNSDHDKQSIPQKR